LGDLSIVAFIAGAVVVNCVYGGAAIWPGLVTNFGASLAAFLLALSWSHATERHRVVQLSQGAHAQRLRAQKELEERLTTEVRRRLEPVREELRRNQISLGFLATHLAKTEVAGTFQILHPELLDGAYRANATRLTELIADFELTSKLSSTYGRIEELRWRLRQRTAQLTTALDSMTAPLVDELLGEVIDLHQRIGAQVIAPAIQPTGLRTDDAAFVTGHGIPLTDAT
jgi:hypothetical protein